MSWTLAKCRFLQGIVLGGDGWLVVAVVLKDYARLHMQLELCCMLALASQ